MGRIAEVIQHLGQVLKFFGIGLILVGGGLLSSIPSIQPPLEMFIAVYRVKYLTIHEKHLEGKIGPTSCECARLQPEERQRQLEELRALMPQYVQELEQRGIIWEKSACLVEHEGFWHDNRVRAKDTLLGKEVRLGWNSGDCSSPVHWVGNGQQAEDERVWTLGKISL